MVANPVINFDQVNPSKVLPAGIYNLRFASIEVESNQYNGCLQLVIEFRVEQPDICKGRALYEYMRLGKTPFKSVNESWPEDYQEYARLDDPDFLNPLTHRFSPDFRKFQKMIVAAGVRPQGETSLKDVAALAVGKIFTAEIVETLHEFGKRKGQEKNEIGEIYPYGSEETYLNRDGAKSNVPKPSGNGTGPVVQPSGLRPTIPNMVMPSVNTEEDDDIPY